MVSSIQTPPFPSAVGLHISKKQGRGAQPPPPPPPRRQEKKK